MSPVSEERVKQITEYNRKTYDRIEIKVKKGEKEALRAYAVQRGETLSGFVNRAILETQQRDQADKPA
ncbi:MAG: hypothetical protein FWE40_02430 [Oscillospiraceae bacterium]|nr:hypothetical protein [Oscillospiraceae bacterium]